PVPFSTNPGTFRGTTQSTLPSGSKQTVITWSVCAMTRFGDGAGATYTATPTAHPSTSPITHARMPRPASSSAASTGRSLVTHVLPAPMASRVTTATTAATVKAVRGVAAN